MTGRCRAPGSLGRHPLGTPDWAGRTTCPCGTVRRYPPGTHGLPPGDPLLAFLARVFAAPVCSLEELAADLGVRLPSAA